MYKPKYSVILANVGSCSDRYLSTGYSDPFTLEQLFDRVASIEHVEGVELIGNWNITTKNIVQIKENLVRTNLKPISIIPDHFGQMKWGKGAFCSKNPAIRAEAIQTTKDMMDAAAEIGCDLISLWPGQDGYDYPFQGDFIEERGWFEEGVKECCKYRRDIKVSIEYKIKEPRNRSYPSTVGTTLLMVKEIDESNCGVTLDTGHAEVAYENIAESVAILKKYGDKLFHVHVNDNYGFWDDDMITGSIHTIPFIEFFYWLKRTNYQGWISTDQYPYREDGREAVNESVQWFVTFMDIVNSMDDSEVERVIKSGNAPEASHMMRKYIFGK